MRRELFKTLVCFSCAVAFGMESSDSGALKRLRWIPTAAETNVALAVTENYCRYTLANLEGMEEDDIEVGWNSTNRILRVAPKKNKKPEYNREWTIYGEPYTNYFRTFKPFVVNTGNNEDQYFIAIQHFYVKDCTTNRAFTVYYNANSGDVGSGLKLSLIQFSPSPPYYVDIKEEKK